MFIKVFVITANSPDAEKLAIVDDFYAMCRICRGIGQVGCPFSQFDIQIGSDVIAVGY